MAESQNERKAVDRFAESVRVARARRQLSQAEVAERAGTTADRIGGIENGLVDPRLSTVERVAAALGLSVEIEETAA